MRARTLVLLLSVLLVAPAPLGAADRPVVIGCKQDVEGQVLAEIMAQLLEDRGFAVQRRFSLGGTKIVFDALATHAIDLYPEYSGTIEQEILHQPGRSSHARLRDLLRTAGQVEGVGPQFGADDQAARLSRGAGAEQCPEDLRRLLRRDVVQRDRRGLGGRVPGRRGGAVAPQDACRALLTAGADGVRRWPIRCDDAGGRLRVGPPGPPLSELDRIWFARRPDWRAGDMCPARCR